MPTAVKFASILLTTCDVIYLTTLYRIANYVVVNMILFSYLCLRRPLRVWQARIMQSLGQTLDIQVLDKDEGNDDDKLGR